MAAEARDSPSLDTPRDFLARTALKIDEAPVKHDRLARTPPRDGIARLAARRKARE